MGIYITGAALIAFTLYFVIEKIVDVTRDRRRGPWR